MNSSEIRREARKSLKGKWVKSVSIALVYLTFSFIIGFLQSFIDENSILFYAIDLAYLIINIPLSFGLLITFMKLKRNENINTFTFFTEGLSRFGKSLGIWFHTFIRLLLPVVCLVLVTSLTVSIGAVSIVTQSNMFLTILILVIFIVTVVYLACRGLLYVIAYNISFDNPKLSSKECVKKSELLMKGHRGSYLLLGLSFIGLAILLAFGFSFGTSLLVTLLGYFGFLLGYALMIIGISFLMAYIQIATICFYEKVAKVETLNDESAEKI